MAIPAKKGMESAKNIIKETWQVHWGKIEMANEGKVALITICVLLAPVLAHGVAAFTRYHVSALKKLV
jgi:hypothetical protein